jgi:hypothetical protein
VRAIVDAVASFYRDTRIAGASLKDEDDGLYLEWGADAPRLLTGFTDFRGLSDENKDKIQFAAQRFQWLGLTRQICAGEDREYDSAVALCAYLFFDAAKGNEPRGSIIIFSPVAIQARLSEFHQVPFVAKLEETQPSRINGFISGIG